MESEEASDEDSGTDARRKPTCLDKMDHTDDELNTARRKDDTNSERPTVNNISPHVPELIPGGD